MIEVPKEAYDIHFTVNLMYMLLTAFNKLRTIYASTNFLINDIKTR